MKMKAIVVTRPGDPENLCLVDYRQPQPTEGMALIKVKAFGLNRAEIYMRKGEFGDTADILGIECVGLIEEDPSGRFKKGDKCAAVCGGMARTINGSYAEYVNVPLTNVVPLRTSLPWAQLAAIPESYMTAWALLHWGLHICEGDNLLVRGATSTLGQACIVLAKQAGLQVWATTRSAGKGPLLKSLGADHLLLDDGNLGQQRGQLPSEGIHHVIELLGTPTLLDSMSILRPHGSLCLAGFLAGMQPLQQFHPMMQMPSGVRLSVFGSAFVFGTRGFELTAIPLQNIVTDIEEGRLRNIYKASFPANDIARAHRLMESNDCNGKLVVEW
jgi:NADPH2:quinone reductase